RAFLQGRQGAQGNRQQIGSLVAEPDTKTHDAESASEIAWTEGARKRMERAPVFLRGMVKRLAEKKARELGYREITEDVLTEFKQQMMGRMGGEDGLQAAAGAIAAGRMPWTAEAKARLETVPEFMRHMIQQIAEDVARERGHMEVNVELFQKVEALGDEQLQEAPPLPWTEGRRLGFSRRSRSRPPSPWTSWRTWSSVTRKSGYANWASPSSTRRP